MNRRARSIAFLALLALAVAPLSATQRQQESTASVSQSRRIVLCLDGTWNSTYDRKYREDGSTVLKPTNVLKLCRAVLPRDSSQREQLTYYDIGVGSLAKYPGLANRLLSLADKGLGGAYGAGFEGNIEDALHFLVFNYEEGDQVYLFGFSRGAATARALTRFLDWSGGLPTKRDAYYLPELFREYIAVHGDGTSSQAIERINQRRTTEKRTRPLDRFRKVNVEFLGVWDTVMALGSRFQAKELSTSTVSKSFHVGSQPARCVKHARQALAIDEERYDFRPEIWTGHAPDQALEQRWFAGVHSNVGGGYPDDGLANLAFHWVLRGALAEEHGLEVDPAFVRIYAGFAQDRLYRSDSFLYRALEALRRRSGGGRRKLFDPTRPREANLSLAASVIHRIQADPATPRFQLRGKPYRPENVLVFLASQPDLLGYLASVEGLRPELRCLSPDVLQRIGEIQKRSGVQIQKGATPVPPC